MHHDIQLFAEYAVTPFVGVWIETLLGGLFGKSNTSHPSWVCGLKLIRIHSKLIGHFVTPFVGVWIETYVDLAEWLNYMVTPFVGVWIETCPSRYVQTASEVTPFVGVWIETP